MSDDALGLVPIWALTIIFVIAFAAIAELGYLAHQRRRGSGPAETEMGDETQVLATALLLLALLLGFTFSMALARYDERRALVVREANDIGTAWLRAGLLATPAGAALQARLATYATTRVAITPAAAADLDSPRAADLRRAIWSATAAAIAPQPSTAQAAALVAAVNAVIDTATTRETALAARVPIRVVTLLIVYAAVSAFLLGYVLGAHQSRHRVATAILFTLLAMTIGLILDLDRAHGGSIQVSQKPLTDLVAELRRSPSAPLSGVPDADVGDRDGAAGIDRLRQASRAGERPGNDHRRQP